MQGRIENWAVLRGEVGQIVLVQVAAPPLPVGDQVLVRMLYAPINPADLLVIDSGYAFDVGQDMPLGAEGVGVVEAIGENAGTLMLGDIVMPLTRGNWCCYRNLPAVDLIKLPSAFDPVQAAMLRINPTTAWLLLAASGAASGEVIVQNAAGSTVATWVRRFAAEKGIVVIDVVRKPEENLPDAIVEGDDLPGRVKTAARGRPVRAALDCVAGTATERLAECLSPNGRLMLFGHLSGNPIKVRSQLLTGRGLSIIGFSLRPAEAALGREGVRLMFADLIALHVADPLILPVRSVIPLRCAPEAIEAARTVGRGRVLLDLSA